MTVKSASRRVEIDMQGPGRSAAMSHSVTVTRTTTTTSGSAIFINTGYLASTPGLLKLVQLILGAACVGILSNYYGMYVSYAYSKPELFFFLVAVALLVGTFCLLVACVMSLSSSTIISKSSYEVVYHSVAFLLYLAAGLALTIHINDRNRKRYSDYEPMLAAGVIGLVLSILYLISAVLAQRVYRGI